jgi:hypothetical protein
MKKYVPLDLPQNLNGFWLLFPSDFRKSMQDCIRQQYAEGNFRSTEDILCDESNTVRFCSTISRRLSIPSRSP